MAAESKKEIELEIAHVLFLDIVGYSKLSVNEQHARVDELNGIVRLSEQYQKAEATNRILKIPTGDGMALVFYRSPEEPAQCAFEISRVLKDNQRLQVRMGIHSGPISPPVMIPLGITVWCVAQFRTSLCKINHGSVTAILARNWRTPVLSQNSIAELTVSISSAETM